MIEAKVILDSLALNGVRLTTFELTYPRFIHAELMTHRAFSRNAASSRAIPTVKKIERIRTDVAKPSEWGVNQKGMQSGGSLAPEVIARTVDLWQKACDNALDIASRLDALGLHKQVANRILEPFDHITVVLSGTKFKNHFKLRLECDPSGRPYADPTYYELALKWKAAYDASVPVVRELHLPYVDETGDPTVLKKISVGRCARVSYLRQGQSDTEENIKLHDRLAASGHWSPFEHVAWPMTDVSFNVFDAFDRYCDSCDADSLGNLRVLKQCSPKRKLNGYLNLCARCSYGHIHSGNFHGWYQYRKDFPNEAGGD